MVSIASIPDREESLRRVVASLLPQVDRLNVYLNGYGQVPPFLDQPKIFVARSEEHGDVGDAGKFFWLGIPVEYFLTCDDDIIYPSDYVRRTIAAIERYGRRAVIGWHGSVLRDGFRDYYEDRTILSFYRNVERDTSVHILGTGTVGFCPSSIRIAPADFRLPNMADVWFGLVGQQQHVPFIVVAHGAGELVPILDEAQHKAIWRDCVENADSVRNTRRAQNHAVLAHGAWVIHRCPASATRSSPTWWIALVGVGTVAILLADAGAEIKGVSVATIAVLACGLRRYWLHRSRKPGA